MYLGKKALKGRGIWGDFTNLPPKGEDYDIPLLLEGSEQARNEVIDGHMRLVLSIATNYVHVLGNYQIADDIISRALESLVDTVERVRTGHKELYDENITSVITSFLHGDIAKFIRELPKIHAPRTTVRERQERGLETFVPKCFRLEIDIPYSDTTVELEDLISQIAPEDNDKAVLSMRLSGMTDQEIADSMGVSRWTIYHIRKKIGERYDSRMD